MSNTERAAFESHELIAPMWPVWQLACAWQRSTLAAQPTSPHVGASPEPEGCTSADAVMLRGANHVLAAENDRLRMRLRAFAQIAVSELSWACVEYHVKGDPEKQVFRAPQMQRAFNRAAEALREDLPGVDPSKLANLDLTDWVKNAKPPVAPTPSASVTGVCETCNGHGMIGGPSYQAPDEGGEPCPDCVTVKGAEDWPEVMSSVYDKDGRVTSATLQVGETVTRMVATQAPATASDAALPVEAKYYPLTLTEAQIDAAIDAYDRTWCAADRGYSNKAAAIEAAIIAAHVSAAAQDGAQALIERCAEACIAEQVEVDHVTDPRPDEAYNRACVSCCDVIMAMIPVPASSKNDDDDAEWERMMGDIGWAAVAVADAAPQDAALPVEAVLTLSDIENCLKTADASWISGNGVQFSAEGWEVFTREILSCNGRKECDE